jgi:hypothetical protein
VASLASKIAERLHGETDAEIATALGCSRDYVRATRGRRGLATPLNQHKREQVECRIAWLEKQLVVAKARLAKINKN